MSRLTTLPLLLAACVSTSGSVRARAASLEAESATCDSFATFEARLAKEREALDATAPAEALVPASQALARARKRCAATTIDGLFERQRQKGREAAVVEVNALTRALGADETTRALQAKWGHDADGFLAEVELSGFTPGPTPEQPAPKEPEGPRHVPTLPGEEHFGEGASCLRRPSREAATCLADWRREGASDAELDATLKAFASRVLKEAQWLDDEPRAVLLGDVLRGLALPQERAPLGPLFEALARLTEQLLTKARALAEQGQVELAASLVRPLLVVDASRRRVEPLSQAASRRHSQLEHDAQSLTLAAQLHRHLAAWFLGVDAPLPSLAPGRWDAAQWGCQLPRPTLPPLSGGVSGRLLGRCRQLPKAEEKQVDPSMRTFDLEASLPRFRVDADVSLTCGGKTTTQRLTVDEVLLDSGVSDLEPARPQRLDGPLAALVASVYAACREHTTREVRVDCARLGGEPLEVTQRFTRHALRLGEWPPCFERWFSSRYGVPPPALRPAR